LAKKQGNWRDEDDGVVYNIDGRLQSALAVGSGWLEHGGVDIKERVDWHLPVMQIA
jgi:hypothetical protein